MIAHALHRYERGRRSDNQVDTCRASVPILVHFTSTCKRVGSGGVDELRGEVVGEVEVVVIPDRHNVERVGRLVAEEIELTGPHVLAKGEQHSRDGLQPNPGSFSNRFDNL